MAGRGKSLRFGDAEIEELCELSYGHPRTFATLAMLYPGLDLTKQFSVQVPGGGTARLPTHADLLVKLRAQNPPELDKTGTVCRVLGGLSVPYFRLPARQPGPCLGGSLSAVEERHGSIEPPSP